jgi:hypothetical protein
MKLLMKASDLIIVFAPESREEKLFIEVSG